MTMEDSASGTITIGAIDEIALEAVVEVLGLTMVRTLRHLFSTFS